MAIGPKADGTYLVEFKTAVGEALAISIPRVETGGAQRNFCARGSLISRPESRVAVLVPTDEELMIAQHKLAFLPKPRRAA